MGFYSRVIFPRICDFLLSSPPIANYRQELLASAQGDILEIGFGSGLNVPHYPEKIRRLTAVDPNPGMQKLAQSRIEQMEMEVDLRVLSGERLPFQDNTFDCIVCTFTLCSIPNVNQAMSEVFRTLKPDGRFLFLEHGLSPDAKVQKWQRRLNWLQMRLADGCRLDRNMQQLVTAHPFSSVEVQNCYVDKLPKTHGYLYRGVATK